MDHKKTILKNFKGFDIVQVMEQPEGSSTFLIFDTKYNSWGKKNYESLEDAKKAATDKSLLYRSMSQYPTVARLLNDE